MNAAQRVLYAGPDPDKQMKLALEYVVKEYVAINEHDVYLSVWVFTDGSSLNYRQRKAPNGAFSLE